VLSQTTAIPPREELMFEPAPTRHTGNRLIDRLPERESQRLLRSFEKVSAPHGQEICRQYGPMPHVYFPTGGMCSIVGATDEGKVVETASVGNEGMIGISVLLGLDFCPSTAISQVPGNGLRMPSPVFLRALEPGGALDRLLRRFIAFSLRYAYQTVVCNAQHSIEERMCQWLLMTQDRVGQAEFVLTQEFLAEMLAVRRQTVTVFAGTLQTAGFISYRRGTMRIINREGLEAASCECYAITKSFYERIMN
jgi:CRP-like cAMP-binding protein